MLIHIIADTDGASVESCLEIGGPLLLSNSEMFL